MQKKNHIFLLLKCIKPKEIKHFQGFLARPSAKNALRNEAFLKYLIPFHPHFDPIPPAEGMFAALEFKEKFNATALSNYLRKFQKEVEDFLILKAVKDEPFLRSNLIQKVANEENVPKLYFRELDRKTDMIERKNLSGFQYQYEKFKIKYDTFFHTTTSKTTREINEDLLLETKDAFDLYYTMLSFQLQSELETARSLSKITKVPSFKEAHSLYKRLPQTDFLDYYKQLTLFRIDFMNPKHDKLSQKIIDNITRLRNEEGLIIFNYILNRNADVNRKSKNSKIEESLELYKMKFSKDSPFKIDHVSVTTFQNILNFCVANNEMEFAKIFIAENIDKTPWKIRQSLRIYSTALVLFTEEKYARVLTVIKKIRPPYNLNLYYRISLLKLKALFEIWDSQKMTTTTEPTVKLFRTQKAFKTFLFKKKQIGNLSEEVYILLNNFLKCQQKLVERNKKYVRDKLETNLPIAERTWLSTKV